MFFNQSFQLQDLPQIAVLVVLEAVLSIDNALVLGLLARRLPVSQRAKALTWGLVGAFLFRFISIAIAQKLLTYKIVKLLGGLYLLYVSLKYFWDLLRGEPHHSPPGGAGTESTSETAAGGSGSSNAPPPVIDAAHVTGHGPAPATRPVVGFWSTVAVIELTDIAFAVDSIVAAIGLVGPPPDPNNWHPKLWVVVLGGIIGVVLMRFAATMFIRLLEMFPRFETAAYLLVAVIGGKLILDWADPNRFDFHNYKSPAFWAFWLTMLASFCVGFIPKKSREPKS